MLDHKIIIKRWNEDGIEKCGFYDEGGRFHLLIGLAKDWKKHCIKVINVKSGDYAEIKEGDLE